MVWRGVFIANEQGTFVYGPNQRGLLVDQVSTPMRRVASVSTPGPALYLGTPESILGR